MAAPSPEPISTVPGQGYGDAAAQQAAQRAIPISAQPVANAPQPTAAVPSAGGGGVPGGASAASPAAGPYAGELTPLTAPTQRPNEPVTAGLPVGPGPGPEALTGVGAQGFAHSNVTNLLTALAQIPGAGADVANLAAYSQSGRA